MIEVGRLCLKIAGRESGRYCVVVKKMDENFVLVTGPRELTSVKRRRCHIDHLEPVTESLDIKSDAPDSEILEAFQKANLVTKLGLEPGKSEVAEKKGMPAEKKAEPKKEKPPERKAEKPKKEKPERKPRKEGKARHSKPAKSPAAKKAAAKGAAKKPAAKKSKK
jgi:large subunit ribosomal protein L14e